MCLPYLYAWLTFDMIQNARTYNVHSLCVHPIAYRILRTVLMERYDGSMWDPNNKNENESATPLGWERSPFNTIIYVIFYVNILYMGCVKTMGANRHIGVTVEGTQTNPVCGLWITCACDLNMDRVIWLPHLIDILKAENARLAVCVVTHICTWRKYGPCEVTPLYKLKIYSL